MPEEDLIALRAAVHTLEHPGLAVRLAEIAGKPIQLVGRALPEATCNAVTAAVTKALNARERTPNPTAQNLRSKRLSRRMKGQK